MLVLHRAITSTVEHHASHVIVARAALVHTAPSVTLIVGVVATLGIVMRLRII